MLLMLAAESGMPAWATVLTALLSFGLGALTLWGRRKEARVDADDRDRNRELFEIKEALTAWRAMVKEQATHLTTVSGRLDDVTARHRSCEADLVRMRQALEKMGVPMEELMPMRRTNDITNRTHQTGSED